MHEMLVVNGLYFRQADVDNVASIYRQNVLPFTYLHLIFPPRFTEEVHWSRQRVKPGKADFNKIVFRRKRPQ